MISHLGAMLPVADGLALAAQLTGTRQVAAAFTGDGATSEGDFHEAVNLAAVWKLPVLFVIENNQYGLSTPVAEQYACRDLADRGHRLRHPRRWCVDGNDLLAVYRAVRGGGRARAGAGDGPTLLEFKTFRMRGHEEASGTAYVPPGAVRGVGAQGSRRPLRAAARRARRPDRGRARRDPRGAEAAHRRAGRRGAGRARPRLHGRARAGATSTPPAACRPQPPAPERWPRRPSALRGRDQRRAARGHAPNPSVVLLGQDIAEYGGVFKVTEGFVEEFGKARVRNTPIIESGALGAALGLALDGFRADGGDAVRRLHHLRLQPDRQQPGQDALPLGRAGAGRGARARWAAASAPGRSTRRTSEAWFTHVAGLKVVAPATPVRREGPAAGRVRGRQPGALPRAQAPVPLREGTGARRATTRCRSAARASRATGRDATVVTYGVGVPWALEAAARAGRRGPPGRGHRPAHAAAVGPRDGARVRAQDRPRAGAARGAAHGRLRRRGRGHHRPARRSSGSTRRWRGWARSTCRSRSARRSRRSSRPRAGCWPALEALLSY